MTYLKGNICSIYLENFLTYNQIQIDPEPHLNVIIGPNGTGKSSVLCGICLGLGGKPELTGRGKSLVEYIKHGEDHAKIQIELYNPDGQNHVIRREFSKSKTGGGHSKWYYQGYEVEEKKIKILVAKLGIQVSNLCQFLPQDRVIEFAKMDKVEMLQSTEKAIGEIELYEQHEALKNYAKSQQNVDTQLSRLKNQLENEIRINSQLEDQVKNIKAKEDLDRGILELDQTLLFCNYNKSRDKYKEMGGHLGKLKTQKDVIEKKMLPNKKNLEKIRNHLKDCNIFLSDKYESLRRSIKKKKDLLDNITREEDNIDIAKESYKNSQISASRGEKEICQLRKNIELYESHLSNVDVNELEVQIRNLTCSINEKNRKIDFIRDDIARHETTQKVRHNAIESVNQELRKIRDGKNRKLQILQSRNRGAYLAAEWLLNNRDAGLFKGAVHEPLFLLLECCDRDSKYIENVVSNQDLIAFVCEDKADMRTLKLEANKNKWAINILYSAPINPETYQPRCPIESLRPYGFEKYVKDTIKAPPSVLGFLCRNYNIHNIPIAQYADLNKIPPNINLYFVGNQRFSNRKSRYDNRISTDVSDIRAPYFLAQVSNSDHEKRVMLQLEKLNNEERSFLEQISPLRAQHQSEERLLDGLRNEKRDKDKILHSRASTLRRIECLREQLLERENNRIDLNLEKEKMNNSIRNCIKRMVALCQKMSAIEDYMKSLNEESLERSFNLSEYQSKEKDILKSMENDQQEALSKSEEIKKIEEEREKICKSAKDILNQLLKSLGVLTYDKIPDDIKESLKHKSINNTLEDLEREKMEKEVHRSCLVVSDDNVLMEYNNRKNLIEELERKRYKMECNLEANVNDIQEVREAWLKKVRQLTAQISEHFSNYMIQLGCAGEVQLDSGSNEDDFSKYGLSIRVKFRDTEKLKELSAQQQSGGERSITTALYLLALQQTPTCPVPFRCVDEINQGMDPTNERKMFTMLVQSMTQSSASQYFIVSPKLLPNLPYNDYVVFLNICNWTSSVNIQSLSTTKILKRIIRKSEEEKKNRKRR